MHQTMDTTTSDHVVEHYAYDYNALPPLAMQKGAAPAGAAVTSVDPRGAPGRARQSLATSTRQTSSARTWPRSVPNSRGRPRTSSSSSSVLSGIDSSRSHPPAARSRWTTTESMFRTIPLPAPANVLHDDDAFAWWRVAGANPTLIQRRDRSSPADERRSPLGACLRGRRSRRARLVGRLVVADYRESLADLVPEATIRMGAKFAYRPAAWFGVPKGSQRLTPIAILLDDGIGALRYAPPPGAGVVGLERGEDRRRVRRRQPSRDHLPPGAHAPLRRAVHRLRPTWRCPTIIRSRCCCGRTSRARSSSTGRRSTSSSPMEAAST